MPPKEQEKDMTAMAAAVEGPAKVVVRLLPPEITEEEFRASIPELQMESCKWLRFHCGKRSKSDKKPSVNSRCYLQMRTQANADEFIASYHGHQFVDSQGEPFRAVACIAPYQKVPRKTQKDPREGTLDDDTVFKAFLDELSVKKEFEAPPDPKAGLRPADPSDTPLLLHMKQRALDRKAKWEKRQSKRWNYMDHLAEEPKRPKWACSECYGVKNLEEDPDDRGVFYCTYCWDTWETVETQAKKKKKKKKKAEDEYAEWDQEEAVETVKKKKKKAQKEADEAWYEGQDGWYEGGVEAESTKKKKKKNKKEGDAGEYGEEWATGWQPTSAKKTTAGAEWTAGWGQEWSAPASQEKKPKKSKYKEDEWWQEATAPSKPKSKSKYDADEQWREAVSWQTDEQSSKPKKNKHKDGVEDASGRKWAPRSSK